MIPLPVQTAVLAWALETTIVAAVLVAFAKAASKSGRLAPATKHILWLVVLCKMVTPPVVHWPWSRPLAAASAVTDPAEPVAKPLDAAPNEPEPRETLITMTPSPESGADADPADTDRTTPELSRSAAAAIVAPPPAITPHVSGRPKLAIRIPPRIQEGLRRLGALSIAAWTGGMLVALCIHIFTILRCGSIVRKGRPAPKWLAAEVEAMAERLGVAPVDVVLTAGTGSPAVWCVGRPRLILPEGLLKSLDRDGRMGVLGHELAHLRRLDHWVRRLQLLGSIVWWWNPIYRLVERGLETEAELACDAWVLWALPDVKFRYAETLLQICSSLSPLCSRTPAPALGMTGPGRFFERRLAMILREPASRRPSLVGVAAAAILALCALPSWSGASLAVSLQDPEPKEKAEHRFVIRHDATDPNAVVTPDDDDEITIVEDADDDDGDGDAKVAKKRLVLRRTQVAPAQAQVRVIVPDEKSAEQKAKELKELSDKLAKDLEKKFGKESDFAKKMELLGKDIEKQFGEGSEFSKKMEALSADLAKKFGEDSEFAKKVEDLTKELEKKLSGELTGRLELIISDMHKDLGPDSKFAVQLKSMADANAKVAKEHATLMLKKLELDRAKIQSDKADELKKRQAERAELQANRALAAAKLRDAAQVARAKAAEARIKVKAKIEKDRAEADELAAKKEIERRVVIRRTQPAKSRAARIEAIEKQLKELMEQLKLLKSEGDSPDDESD